MKASVNLSVFVFYDTLDVLDIIKPVIAPCFHSTTKISMQTDHNLFCRQMKEKHFAALFVFVCSEPKHALEFIEKLEEISETNIWQSIPSQSILICDKDMRAKAFSLCRKGVFYSYETMRPIYDIDKVRLTLNRVSQYAMTQAELHYKELESQSMNDEIRKSNGELDNLLATLTEEKQRSISITQDIAEHHSPHLSKHEWQQAVQKMMDSLANDERHNFEHLLSRSPVGKKALELSEQQKAMFDKFELGIEKAKPKLFGDDANFPVVVVADDQPVMQKIIRSILEPRGFRVELANNGVEVLLKAQMSNPDLILLDIDMPVMNGFETLAMLKGTPSLQTIPVIMLTSFSDKEIFNKAVRSGAMDYIVKPTSAEILVRKIKQFIPTIG